MNLPLEVESFLDEQKMFDENDPEYSVIPLLMEKFNVSEEVASSYANEYITLLFEDDGQPTEYEEWNDFIVRNVKHQAFLNSQVAKANQEVWDNAKKNLRNVEENDKELVERRDGLEEDKEVHFKEFSRYMRDLLTDFGFDSIEYINYHEHELSRSYIVFNDGQFKTTDSLAWRPENLGMGFKKVLDETVADEVKKTMPLAVESTKQLSKGIVGNARADGFLTKMQRLVEPLATVPGWEELEVGRMLAKGESTIAVNQARVIFLIRLIEKKRRLSLSTSLQEVPLQIIYQHERLITQR